MEKAQSAWNEWRTGYPLVFASMLGMFVSTTHMYSIGVLTAPIEAEFGWSRAEISAGMLIAGGIAAFGAPVIGMLIDRFGTRPIGIAGIMIYCASFSLLATSPNSLWSWWILWALVGLGYTFIQPTVWAAAISSAFDRHRGLAMAAMLTGSSLSALVVPLLLFNLIDGYGWRTAVVLMGGAAALVVLPNLILFFRARGDRHAWRKGGGEQPGGIPLGQALRNTRFLRLALIALLLTGAIVGINMQLVPIFSSLGLDRGAAAQMAGAVGIGSIVGRLGTGYLLDRYHGTLVGGLSFSAPVAGAILLLSADMSQASAFFVAFLLGMGAGAETDMVAYLCTRYFGLRSYGAVFGVLASMFAIGSGVGPTASAAAYDHFGSYIPFIWAALGCFLLAILCVVSLGPYPDFREASEAGSRPGHK